MKRSFIINVAALELLFIIIVIAMVLLWHEFKVILLMDDTHTQLLPFLLILVILALAVLGKALISIWFPNFVKEQESKRTEKYGSCHGVVCPYCKSVDTYKISNISKGVAFGIWGKYALPKVCKQWHCNNCNSDF